MSARSAQNGVRNPFKPIELMEGGPATQACNKVRRGRSVIPEPPSLIVSATLTSLILRRTTTK